MYVTMTLNKLYTLSMPKYQGKSENHQTNILTTKKVIEIQKSIRQKIFEFY